MTHFCLTFWTGLIDWEMSPDELEATMEATLGSFFV